jgi:hypothetical protein
VFVAWTSVDKSIDSRWFLAWVTRSSIRAISDGTVPWSFRNSCDVTTPKFQLLGFYQETASYTIHHSAYLPPKDSRQYRKHAATLRWTSPTGDIYAHSSRHRYVTGVTNASRHGSIWDYTNWWPCNSRQKKRESIDLSTLVHATNTMKYHEEKSYWHFPTLFILCLSAIILFLTYISKSYWTKLITTRFTSLNVLSSTTSPPDAVQDAPSTSRDTKATDDSHHNCVTTFAAYPLRITSKHLDKRCK